MKALSLTQPWATLIAIGAKRIETRSWSTAHRGTLAIHAAKGFPLNCRDLATGAALFRTPLHEAGYQDGRGLPVGAIVAVASLQYVFMTGDALNYQHKTRTCLMPGGRTFTIRPTEIHFGNYEPGRFGWVLADVIALPTPIPCKGALGLWTVPPAVQTSIDLQLVAMNEVAR